MGEKASITWQELSGSEDWSLLLEPQLDEDLREYIIQYGEKAQSITDAFNNEDSSPARGFSRYPMEGFFSNVGLELNHAVKYEVTQFIYALEKVEQDTGGIAEAEVSWIAYVAVAKEGIEQLGRRDILVVWKPTSTEIEGIVDIDAILVSAFDIFGENVMVHEGWHGVYTAADDGSLTDRNEYVKLSARDQVLNEVDKQIKAYEGEENEISITVVGHSMGGALATLNAMDIVANGHNLYQPSNPELSKACQVTVFAFASPKVGDQSFKDLFDTLNKDKDKNLHALRIFNAVDIVPNLPPVGYVHVGEQLVVDSRKSPHLKQISGLGYLQLAHDLEPLLHVVSGWKGQDMDFDPNFSRDLSLVNKDMDALADKGIAPASWWVVQNKGMVQKDDGSWALEDYIPPPPQF